MSRPTPAHRPIGELASEAAELIRVARQVAQLSEYSALLDTGQVSEAVHALQALASHLPELLDRLGTVLSSEQASGRLTSVSSDISEMDLVRIARDTRDQLGEAGRIAGVLGETLTLAETSLAGIGKPWGVASVRPDDLPVDDDGSSARPRR
ncbi:hypothetical protein GCM10009664_55120 [Kitasatospora gansuensis]